MFKRRKVESNFAPKDLLGICIYQEPSRTVYAFPFSKRGYVITYDNLQSYNKWSLRGLLSLLIMGIYILFFNNYFKGFLACASLYLFLTALFRTRFLEGCPVIEPYKRPKRNLIKEIARKETYPKLIFTMTLTNICFFSIGVSSFVLAPDIENIIFSILLLATLAAIFIVEIIIVVTKRKSEVD